MSSELEEENITGLVEVKKTTVLAAFTGDDGLDSIVQQTKDLVAGFDHDMSTGASRARTASLAAKVAKLKTSLDGMGKDLVSGWKTKAKAVDKNRKSMRDSLDELKILARKPLTDWEAEQAAIEEQKRIEAEKLEAERHKKELADKLAADIEAGHELGLLLNADHDREVQAAVDRKAAEIVRVAEIQKELDEAAIQDALEDERIKAEAIAREVAEEVELEKQRVIKMAQDARAAKEQADRDKIAAQESRRIESENAERARVAAKEQADRDATAAAEDARLAEIKRQKDEAALVEADRIKREKNTAHIGKIRKKVKEQLMQFADIDEETARRVVLAVKDIDDLNIVY